ncbi:MAG: FliI/YscN family ATPase [Aquabacterium sp.]
MHDALKAVRAAEPFDRLGRVIEIRGQSIEAEGPDAFLGEICSIQTGPGGQSIDAEVVAFRDGRVCLTPLSPPLGIPIGASVLAKGHPFQCPVGDAFLGRVVDACGQPMDELGPIAFDEMRTLHATPRPVLSRQRINEVLETGVKAIDTFLPLGKGQRVGLFAGSGVGKSTLLGMVTKGIQADINVVALIGERGREVREFVEDHLGDEGMARAVVVVATADAPAVLRLNAAYYATTLAEYFRDQGKSVVLTVDSLTRLAMARREIGLSAGEPPTSRGYTPSVFSEIPALCERCGTDAGQGAITGIYTVLVEGDDFNEPVSDTARATLDGHIMLSRTLASAGHYPPIDLLHSVSRLASSLWQPDQRQMVATLLERMSTYERNRQLVEIGAHRPGSNPELDLAVALLPRLRQFLTQSSDSSFTVSDAWADLTRVVAHQPDRGAAR